MRTFPPIIPQYINFIAFVGLCLAISALGILLDFWALLVTLFVICISLLFWRWPIKGLLVFCIVALPQETIAIIFENEIDPALSLLRNADELIIVCFTIITILRWWRNKQFVVSRIIAVSFGLVIVFGIMSSLLQRVPPYIALPGLFLIVKGPLLFFIAAGTSVRQSELRTIIKWGLISGYSILVLAMIELLDPKGFRLLLGGIIEVEYRVGFPALKSVFYHPGTFGWFCAFISVFYLAFYFVYGKRRYLLGAAIFGLGSFLSARRKPLFGILGSSMLGIAATAGRSIRQWGRFILAFSLIALVVWIAIGEQLENLVLAGIFSYFESDDAIYHARNILTLGSAQIAMDYFPLGVGFGRYGSWISWVYYSPVYYQYGMSSIWGLSVSNPNFITDTFWPMILGETGLFGCMFYMFACFNIGKTLFRKYLEFSEPLVKAFILGGFLVFVEALIESIAQPIFSKPPEAYLVFITVGLAYSLGSQTNAKVTRLPPLNS